MESVSLASLTDLQQRPPSNLVCAVHLFDITGTWWPLVLYYRYLMATCFVLPVLGGHLFCITGTWWPPRGHQQAGWQDGIILSSGRYVPTKKLQQERDLLASVDARLIEESL